MALSLVAKFRTGSYSKFYAFRLNLKRCCTTNNVRLRFAPSPTGMLHLGGLRTALFNYLFAKSKGGKFILRIEDTDLKRSVPGAIEKLESMLGWLGLTPDEGPSQGGNYGPYFQARCKSLDEQVQTNSADFISLTHILSASLNLKASHYSSQSQRLKLYRENMDRLLQSGHCYMCFCTQRRLQLLNRDQARRGETSGYDNKCRGLTEAQVNHNLEMNLPYVIRFKYEPVKVEWQDLVYGHMESGTDLEEGDFICEKSDGYPTYHFANVVDDHYMKVTHVLRGQEWQTSTPKHIQMYNAFGWTPPEYAHLPLILNRDGTKLSKRQNDITVEHFKDRDYEPDAVLNYITSTGSGFTESTAGKTLQEMVPLFSVDKITRHSGRLAQINLAKVNMQHLQRLLEVDKTSLVERVRDLWKANYSDRLRDDVDREWILSDSYIESVLTWSLTEQRISQLQDLFNDTFEFIWILPSHEQLSSVLITEFDCNSIIQEVREKLDTIDSAQFEIDSLKETVFFHCKANGIPVSKYMRLLRVCLGGRKEGPPVAEMMAILGKDETMNRLKYAWEKLKSNVAEEQLKSNVET